MANPEMRSYPPLITLKRETCHHLEPHGIFAESVGDCLRGGSEINFDRALRANREFLIVLVLFSFVEDSRAKR